MVMHLRVAGTCPALTRRARRRTPSSKLAEQEVATGLGWALGSGQKTLMLFFFLTFYL